MLHLTPILNILVFFFISQIVFAQPGIYTEDDVAFQTKFMEAQEAKYTDKPDKQVEILKELIQMDRNCHSCYYEISLAYKKQDDYLKAETSIEKALKLDSKNKSYLHAATDIFVENKSEQKAIDTYQKLISLSPYDSFLSQSYIRNLIELGNSKEALSEIKKYEAKEGISELSTQWKINIYKDSGDDKKQLESIKALSEAHPTNVRFMNNLASKYGEMGNENKAMDIYKKVLSIDPDDPTANLVMVSKDIDNADDSQYLRAVMPLIENKSIPMDDKIKELIPYVQKMDKNPESEANSQLVKASNKLIQLYPEDGKVYALRGDIFYHTGQYLKAEEDYKKTIEINPNIYEVWDIRMRNAIQMGDNKLLKRLANQSIDLFPLKFNPYFFAGLGEIQDNNNDEAQSQIDEASFIASNNPLFNARIDLLKSKLALHEKDTDKALGLLSKYEEVNVEEFLLYETLGDIYSQKNDKSKADKFWQLSKNMGNSSSTILKKTGV